MANGYSASSGPVQSNTLYASGSFAAGGDFNFTTTRVSNTPGSAGALTEIARYDTPPATTMRFAGGRKFIMILQGASAQMTAGYITIGVQDQDGSRTIFYKAGLITLGAIAVQQDDLKKPGYTTTAYASGAKGDVVVLLVDDGGTAWDFDNAANVVNMPYDYRVG